jgi:DNA-binding MarR family transcriptional regulator
VGLEPTPTQELWFGLLAVREQLVDALDEQLRGRHELPLSAFVVLVTLVKHDEPVAVSTLAPLVSLVSRSQVSRLVDALSARGLVERTRGTRDGRVHAVRITDAGRVLAADGLRCADEVAERLVVARLPAVDVRALRRALGRLTGYPPDASGARRDRPGGA